MSNPHHPTPETATPIPATGDALATEATTEATTEPATEAAALSDEALADAAGGGIFEDLVSKLLPVVSTVTPLPNPNLIPPGLNPDSFIRSK